MLGFGRLKQLAGISFSALSARVSGGAGDPSSGYELFLPFSATSPTYRVGASTYSPVTTLPGYTYTRSGAKGELNNLANPADVIDDFAANVAGIVPGKGYFSRGALTNDFVRSQEFDNASWNKTAVSVTANTVVAPDGTTTGDTMTTSGVATAQYVFQGDVQTGQRAYSVMLKAGTGRYVQIAHGSVATMYANFDLVSGILGTVGATAAAYIAACGNGWYRCVMLASPGATGSTIIGVIPASTSGYVPAHTATVDTVYIWQAQSIAGNHPDGGPIIVTGAATAAIGADVLSHTMTAPTDVDQVFFVKVNVAAIPTGTRMAFQLDDGTAANKIQLYLEGGLTTLHVMAASATIHYTSSTSIVAGQDTILVLRRLGGAWRPGKIIAGALTWLAAGGAGGIPAGLTVSRVGNKEDSLAQFEGRVLNSGIKVGTFTTDAEVIAAVSI